MRDEQGTVLAYEGTLPNKGQDILPAPEPAKSYTVTFVIMTEEKIQQKRPESMENSVIFRHRPVKDMCLTDGIRQVVRKLI